MLPEHLHVRRLFFLLVEFRELERGERRTKRAPFKETSLIKSFRGVKGRDATPKKCSDTSRDAVHTRIHIVIAPPGTQIHHEKSPGA